jgi:hypothetical protein
MTKHKKIKLKKRILFVIVVGGVYLTEDFINAGLSTFDNVLYRLMYILIAGYSLFWIMVKVTKIDENIRGNKDRHYEIMQRASAIHQLFINSERHA